MNDLPYQKIVESYGDDVAADVRARAHGNDTDAIYSALEQVMVERSKSRMENLTALRRQHCTSAVPLRQKSNDDVSAEEIAALATARRKFRLV